MDIRYIYIYICVINKISCIRPDILVLDLKKFFMVGGWISAPILPNGGGGGGKTKMDSFSLDRKLYSIFILKSNIFSICIFNVTWYYVQIVLSGFIIKCISILDCFLFLEHEEHPFNSGTHLCNHPEQNSLCFHKGSRKKIKLQRAFKLHLKYFLIEQFKNSVRIRP